MTKKNIFKFTDIQSKRNYEFYSSDLKLAGAITVPDETGKFAPCYIIGFKSNSKQFMVDKTAFKSALRLIENNRRKHD